MRMMYVLKCSFTITFFLIPKSQSNQFLARLPYDVLAIGKCVVHNRQCTLISKHIPLATSYMFTPMPTTCRSLRLTQSPVTLMSMLGTRISLPSSMGDISPPTSISPSMIKTTMLSTYHWVVRSCRLDASSLHGSNVIMQVALPNLTPPSMIYLSDVCYGESN